MADVAEARRILSGYVPDNRPWQEVGTRAVRIVDILAALKALDENPRVRTY